MPLPACNRISLPDTLTLIYKIPPTPPPPHSSASFFAKCRSCSDKSRETVKKKEETLEKNNFSQKWDCNYRWLRGGGGEEKNKRNTYLGGKRGYNSARGGGRRRRRNSGSNDSGQITRVFEKYLDFVFTPRGMRRYHESLILTKLHARARTILPSDWVTQGSFSLLCVCARATTTTFVYNYSQLNLTSITMDAIPRRTWYRCVPDARGDSDE